MFGPVNVLIENNTGVTIDLEAGTGLADNLTGNAAANVLRDNDGNDIVFFTAAERRRRGRHAGDRSRVSEFSKSTRSNGLTVLEHLESGEVTRLRDIEAITFEDGDIVL